MSQFADVVIVGSGASGLRLAGILHRAGVSVVVLEASNRVGGRLLTVEPGVDLGATWFWQNEKDVLEVIAECGLVTFPQHVSGNMMYQGNGAVSQIEGNPLDQQAWRIVGGMQKLADEMEKVLPRETVKLSTKVNKIVFHDQVQISTNNDQWIAKTVVVALPPAMAIANITFNPELPNELQSIASQTPVWMGAITKVVAIYDAPFWRAKGLAGSAISHTGPLREIHDVSDQGATFGALFGFSPRNVTQAEAIQQFVELFGEEAQSPKTILIKNWSESEFISPVNVSELNNYQLFGSDIFSNSYFDKRLYFSSTETAHNSAGHIPGSLILDISCNSTTSKICGIQPTLNNC
jgi:monoamine oxidase